MIKNIINSITPMSQQSLNSIESLVNVENFSKGETFIKRHKYNNKEYFVLDGICKSYLVNPDGEEITISFFTSQSILSPHTTRTRDSLSVFNIKALTDIQVATIDAKDFESLMIENLEIRNFANTVLRNELAIKIDKEIGLATLTAKERLIRFREQFPMLENSIPHPDIASYLGITNISLSRIRSELASK